MNGKSFVLLATAAFLRLTGCQHVAEHLGTNSANNSGAQSTPDEFAATRAVFDKNCKGCHGETGNGGPVKLPDGTKWKVPGLGEAKRSVNRDRISSSRITKAAAACRASARR